MLQAAEILAAPTPGIAGAGKLPACASYGEREQDFAVLARQAERETGLA